MYRLTSILAIAVLLTVSFAPTAHAWRKQYRHQHRSTRVSNTGALKSCTATCTATYGTDGIKCKTLPVKEKKTCRDKSRTCYTKCWNKYH